MHRVNLYAHAFFVPHRLLLKTGQWESFIVGDGAYTVLPTITNGAFTGQAFSQAPAAGDLFDALDYGFPISAFPGTNVTSQMPLRAYWRIYNDFYRDQNFVPAIDVTGWPQTLDGTADYRQYYTPAKRAWEKDYFTSALATQQRGSAVNMVLNPAPVKGKDQRTGQAADGVQFTGVGVNSNPAAGPVTMSGTTKYPSSGGSQISVFGNLEADLSAIGLTVTALRQAFSLQRWYEASMRFGQRYIEQILGLFGEETKDARLQRPEFLGGGKLPVVIGEVLQTSRSDAGSTPQGTMTGRGITSGSVFGFDKKFDEHGTVMILVSVMPRTSYMGYANRFIFKTDKFDFAFPQLAHLSEQPVYQRELLNSAAAGTTIFGYQPQYSEYRYIPDSVHGQFRSTLKFWGLTREFAAPPSLNQTFVECTPRTDIWPVISTDQLLLQSFAKVTAIRPLPKFGTPI